MVCVCTHVIAYGHALPIHLILSVTPAGVWDMVLPVFVGEQTTTVELKTDKQEGRGEIHFQLPLLSCKVPSAVPYNLICVIRETN